MDELQKEIVLKLFNEWLDEKHPYYHFICGVMYLLFAAMYIFCVLSLWFYSA